MNLIMAATMLNAINPAIPYTMSANSISPVFVIFCPISMAKVITMICERQKMNVIIKKCCFRASDLKIGYVMAIIMKPNKPITRKCNVLSLKLYSKVSLSVRMKLWMTAMSSTSLYRNFAKIINPF